MTEKTDIRDSDEKVVEIEMERFSRSYAFAPSGRIIRSSISTAIQFIY